MDPTYIVWQPVIIRKNNKSYLFINLTRSEFIETSLIFYNDLLNELGISSNAVNVEIIHTRCQYTGWGDESDSWIEKWPYNWMVFIELSSDPGEYKMDEEDLEIFLFTDDIKTEYQWYNGERKNPVGCLIIADFKSNKDIIEIKDQIKNIGFTGLNFFEKDINSEYYQLQIYLGEVDESFFQKENKQFKELNMIIEKYSGITFFEKRIEEWGEIESEDL